MYLYFRRLLFRPLSSHLLQKVLSIFRLGLGIHMDNERVPKVFKSGNEPDSLHRFLVSHDQVEKFQIFRVVKLKPSGVGVAVLVVILICDSAWTFCRKTVFLVRQGGLCGRG